MGLGSALVTALIVFLVVAVSHELALFIGFAVIVVTAVVSTLIMGYVFSGALAKDWRQQRMLDLMMTPLTGPEIARGLLWGQTAAWLIWLAVAAVMSLALLIVANQGHSSRFSEAGELGEQLVIWGMAVFYGITQTLWAAAWAFDCMTRFRSPMAMPSRRACGRAQGWPVSG